MHPQQRTEKRWITHSLTLTQYRDEIVFSIAAVKYFSRARPKYFAVAIKWKYFLKLTSMLTWTDDVLAWLDFQDRRFPRPSSILTVSGLHPPPRRWTRSASATLWMLCSRISSTEISSRYNRCWVNEISQVYSFIWWLSDKHYFLFLVQSTQLLRAIILPGSNGFVH